MKLYILSILFIVTTCIPILTAQADKSILEGKVYEKTDEGVNPLIGANIYWLGTSLGTVSSSDGTFAIDRVSSTNFLVVSFTGFATDTLEISGLNSLEVTLDKDLTLKSVSVVKRLKTKSFTLLDPIKLEQIGECELEKAACCNLSESFETNASVDVSFTDAVTGTKQIQMLGLAGIYSQITRENMPDIRGLSAIYGMEYVPGSWIESIQINKGTGSVVNGFESITGQINVELRKPETADKLYFNLYSNEDSRVEANLNLAHKINEQLSTGLLLHARHQQVEMDRNQDGFMDKPVGDQYIILNRWKLKTKSNWSSQLGIKATYNTNTGGQIEPSDFNNESLWKMKMETNRLEGWFKLGKVFDNNPTQSIALQASAVHHDQQSTFGLKNYEGLQQSAYANLIFQSAKNVYHNYKLGSSFQYDRYSENLDSLEFKRNELIPGVFGEYSFLPNDRMTAVIGLRADYHSDYGLFFTPRIHARYGISDKSVLRFSAGKGRRTATIIAENNAVLASSRVFQIRSAQEKYPYGLDQEEAWNFGANFTQKFTLDYRDGVFSLDLYRTVFKSQVVVDLEESPQAVIFYNLDGKSVSNSLQAEFDYELLRRLDFRVAYRYNQVLTSYYSSGLEEKPLQAPHRAFINLGYSTVNQWKFDYTVQWQSSKRIPSTESNIAEYQMETHSPSFFVMNAQITKEWRDIFEVYMGLENILDFKQDNPILASDDPFGPYFDSSLIWGPVFGRMIYAGIRLRISTKE